MKHWFMQTGNSTKTWDTLSEKEQARSIAETTAETTAEDLTFIGGSLGLMQTFAEMDGGTIFILDGGIWKLFREQDYDYDTKFLYSKKDWDGHACIGYK